MLLSLILACGKDPQAVETPEPPPPPPAPEKAAVTELPVSGSVGVVTIKNGSAEVPGSFSGVSGQVAVSGHFASVDGQVSVDLSSWDSGLELRDDRVRETFFDLRAHPVASFDLGSVEGLPEGGPAEEGSPVTVKGLLGLNGVEHELAVAATLAAAGEGYTLTTSAPFEVGIEAHGLAERLAALIELCAHESVADTVAVSLDLALGEVPEPAVEEPAESAEEPAVGGDPAPAAEEAASPGDGGP